MFTVSQAAKTTGINRRKILRAIAAGKLPAVKAGPGTAVWLIREADLKQWAHKHN